MRCDINFNFSESFVVCLDYRPPKNFDPALISPYLNVTYTDFGNLTGINRKVIPYLVCGDLSGWDSDTTYPLKLSEGEEYRYHEPVQPPLAPPHEKSKNKLSKMKESHAANISTTHNSSIDSVLTAEFDELNLGNYKDVSCFINEGEIELDRIVKKDEFRSFTNEENLLFVKEKENTQQSTFDDIKGEFKKNAEENNTLGNLNVKTIEDLKNDTFEELKEEIFELLEKETSELSKNAAELPKEKTSDVLKEETTEVLKDTLEELQNTTEISKDTSKESNGTMEKLRDASKDLMNTAGTSEKLRVQKQFKNQESKLEKSKENTPEDSAPELSLNLQMPSSATFSFQMPFSSATIMNDPVQFLNFSEPPSEYLSEYENQETAHHFRSESNERITSSFRKLNNDPPHFQLPQYKMNDTIPFSEDDVKNTFDDFFKKIEGQRRKKPDISEITKDNCVSGERSETKKKQLHIDGELLKIYKAFQGVDTQEKINNCQESLENAMRMLHTEYFINCTCFDILDVENGEKDLDSGNQNFRGLRGSNI